MKSWFPAEQYPACETHIGKLHVGVHLSVNAQYTSPLDELLFPLNPPKTNTFEPNVAATGALRTQDIGAHVDHRVAPSSSFSQSRNLRSPQRPPMAYRVRSMAVRM